MLVELLSVTVFAESFGLAVLQIFLSPLSRAGFAVFSYILARLVALVHLNNMIFLHLVFIVIVKEECVI